MSQRKFDFYIVPTPIGNIADITLRAIEVLQEVDIIACEDTRTTQKLLNHYNIKTKTISYHKYNEHERIEFFLQELSQGKKLALVSDAGTPMICDPGTVIIKQLISNGYSVTALPGASAVTTFLSQAPRDNEEFTFIGFISKQITQIQEIVQRYNHTNLVFYDSPERILKTLNTIYEVRRNAKIAIGRELSKLFEEVLTGDIPCVLNHFKTGIKGEIVCMIYADDKNSDKDYVLKIKALKNKGFKDKEIAIILSTLFKLNKNEIYKASVQIGANNLSDESLER